MHISETMMAKISKMRPTPADNVRDFVSGMNAHAATFKLDRPQRLGQFIPQIMHETGGLRWNREIWGPTPQQKRYERDFSKPWTRTNQRNRVAFNLGNTERGDGSLFRGYGFIQTTGRFNVTAFLKWCRDKGLDPPDFLRQPHLIAAAPWSTLSAVWFWESRNLNALADEGETELITIRINGGRTGLEDRISYANRTALVLLGYGPIDVRAFQRDQRLTVDGVAGPRTRAALHKALSVLEREVA